MQQVNNFSQNLVELGLDYNLCSGSVVGVQVCKIDGWYLNDVLVGIEFINNLFIQEDYKFKVIWLYSVKIKLQFLGGLIQWDCKLFMGGGGYCGFNVCLVGDWVVIGKIGFVVNLWCEIGGVNDVDVNFVLIIGVSFGVIYLLMVKLWVEGLVDVEWCNYNGVFIVIGVMLLSCWDSYEKVSLSLMYVLMIFLLILLVVYCENL